MSTQTQQEYRTLEPHETIEPGDEFKSVYDAWAPVHTSIGHTPAFMKQEYRRPIKPEPITNHRHCHHCRAPIGLGYRTDNDGHEFCGDRCVESYRKSPPDEIAWKRECLAWKDVWESPEALHSNLLRSPLYPEMRMKFLHLAGATDYDALKASREKLHAFKSYVHARLDEARVPIDPESPHKAEGCRIGGRLDWILARIEELNSYIVECERLRQEAVQSERRAWKAAIAQEKRAEETQDERDNLQQDIKAVSECNANQAETIREQRHEINRLNSELSKALADRDTRIGQIRLLKAEMEDMQRHIDAMEDAK